MKGLLYILGLVSILAACTSVECSEYGMVTCTYDVVNFDGETDTIPQLFSVTTKRSINGNDTTLLNQQSTTTTFELQMSYVLPTDTLYFSITNSTTAETVLRDTVCISKTDHPHYEANDCAPRYYHTIQKVWSTHHFIDTLLINNSAVQNNEAPTNILVVIPDL